VRASVGVAGGMSNASDTSCSKSLIENEGERLRPRPSSSRVRLRKTCILGEGNGGGAEEDMVVSEEES
jgi:hypothetical protein